MRDHKNAQTPFFRVIFRYIQLCVKSTTLGLKTLSLIGVSLIGMILYLLIQTLILLTHLH